MKAKIFTLFITFLCSIPLFGADYDQKITITTNKQGIFKFKLGSLIDIQPARIHWGNGKVQNINALTIWGGGAVQSDHSLEGETTFVIEGSGFFLLDVSAEEGDNNEVTSITFSNIGGMETIRCANNRLTSLTLPSKRSQLLRVYCENNEITELDASNAPILYDLQCYNNKLTKLNIDNSPDIVTLRCEKNNISELNTEKLSRLKIFTCGENNITTLNLKNCSNLENFSCGDNPIKQLDVTKCTNLYWFMMHSTEIESIDLSKNLKLHELGAHYNKLKTLDVSNNVNLAHFSCQGNEISSLDLSNNKKLITIHCGFNPLNTLDLSNNLNVTNLSIRNSQFSTIDVSKLSKLTSLEVYENNFTFSTLPVNKSSYTLYNYKNQSDVKILEKGNIINLSSQYSALDEDNNTFITNYKWKTKTNIVLEKGVDYTENKGVFTFLKTPTAKVYCEMTNAAFPDLALKTTEVEITGLTTSVTSVSLNYTTKELAVGDTLRLIATVNPENASNKETSWKSNNANIASVDDNGKITAKSVGKATITVTTKDGEKTAACEITVKEKQAETNPIPVTGISLDKDTIHLNINQSLTIKATIKPDSASNKGINWKSGNNTIAVVDSTGLVKAVSPGKTFIIATSKDKNISDSCVVIVEDSSNSLEINSEDKNEQGTITISLSIPDSVTITGSFVLQLPKGLSLNLLLTKLAADLIDNFDLSITKGDNNTWSFNIIAKGLRNETLLSQELRDILFIAYDKEENMSEGKYDVALKKINLQLSNGEEIVEEEITYELTISGNITGISNIPQTKEIIYKNGNQLIINSPASERILIYTITGQLIHNIDKQPGEINVNIKNIPQNILIVKGSSGWTRKINN